MAGNLFNDLYDVRVLQGLLEYFLNDDINTARNEIFQFLESVGINKAESIVPEYDPILDEAVSRTILTLLLKYAECLSRSKKIEDVRELMLVIEKIDPWLTALDSDMEGRSELVKHLLKPTSYNDNYDELAAERIAVTLLEHNKVCKDDRTMIQLGKALVSREELWEELEFLRKVLGHLDRKCQVVDARELTWATCLMKLQTSYEGKLHPKICLTMQSVILDLHLEDALCDRGSDLLEPMNLIAKARASGDDDDCIQNLDDAIYLLNNWSVNTNEQGSHDFLLGQAFCLRALSHYELRNSTEGFSRDIGEALKLLTSSDYKHLADKYQSLSSYTTKLLYYVLDVIITEHNDEGLSKEIVSLFERSHEMGMLWQFKSHHNHLNSDYQLQTNTVDQDFAKDYNFVVEEGESIETLERMVSNIDSKVSMSKKSRCRLAQLYYDLAERMLLMGSMTKALEYATQGLKNRESLLYECFIVNESTWCMDSLVAAHAWSIRFKDFILAPNYNFICFLSSIYQKATILELIGSGHEDLPKLKWAKNFSLSRGLLFYVAHFQALIGRIHRKIQDFDKAKTGLVEAQKHYNHVSCEKCKLILEHDIRKECVKQTRTNGLPVKEAMEKFLSVEHMLKNHLDTKSHESSKSWERTCRLCLLSILHEKGKEHVYAKEKMEACKVFLENISMVISLISVPEPSPAPTTLVELLELVRNKEIQVLYGRHIAELIYIICWVAYTEDNETSDFYIPKEMLIATLKHALILSTETPELNKKVAQLLAIMYMLKYDEEETPKSEDSLTHWQWACFFHQLTVGCGVDYLFSLRLSKVYGDSDAVKILHRLTPRSGVDDLSDFVKEFYNELEPHTIVVMNVLGPKYMKFMEMFLPFLETSESVACLMISRFDSTCQPRYKLFTVNSSGPAVLGPEKSPWMAPWGTNTIVDRMLPDFKMLIKDYHTWSLHDTHERRLSKIISHMESWLGPNKNILLGEILKGVNDSKTAPVILVLGNEIHMLPWEIMKILENQEIYRMPSVMSIFYTYEKCYKSGRNTVKDIASYATLDPSDAYYVINPRLESIDEWRLEASLNDKFHLKGIIWKAVAVEEILEILKSRSLFIYCGHGDGLQYISRNALKTLEVCASAFLMGCSSGLLKLVGPYTPLAAPIDYLLAGSPIVMCNLWNIHEHWALELTEILLQTFKEKMEGRLTRTLLGTFEERMEDEAGIVACLHLARNNTPDLMYRAITVCYGVPTVLKKRMP